eukprot:CAMPEP_0173325600 /NCGR_PEP_ID=MMETSP1144-20121109/601_1 /TAXON_ID=483371 /ORGANISM="non described non described, Strain CCMP2298" /LENGTH=122 /DNA_ID=CAMNT_0014269819 /DNA_START=21 /DNA_END=386 /DNA_ORIENTATION=+
MEFYMARHMQRVMQSIADRVVITNLNALSLLQTYTVQIRRKTRVVGAASVFASNTGLSFMADSNTGHNATQLVVTELAGSDASHPGDVLSRTQSAVSVHFQDWVVQVNHQLSLTRGICVRTY